MTGNGLVIAFTLIYLHQARAIALPVVGALSAAVGVLAVTVSGGLLDRARPAPGAHWHHSRAAPLARQMQAGWGGQVRRRHCQPGWTSSSVPFSAGPVRAGRSMKFST
jgi:hypothetical protein